MFWGIACLAIVVVWAGSYFGWQIGYTRILGNFQIASGFGQLSFSRGTGFSFGCPHILPIMLFGGFAATPWVRWSSRYSLRALLIATTMIAIALGLLVWTGRK
jgi:hypothetical protein